MRRTVLIGVRAGLSLSGWLALLGGCWALASGLFFIAFLVVCIPLSRSAE